MKGLMVCSVVHPCGEAYDCQEFSGSRSAGRPRKRGLDTVKDCLNVRQARRMVQDRSKWWGFEMNAWVIARGMNT